MDGGRAKTKYQKLKYAELRIRQAIAKIAEAIDTLEYDPNPSPHLAIPLRSQLEQLETHAQVIEAAKKEAEGIEETED